MPMANSISSTCLVVRFCQRSQGIPVAVVDLTPTYLPNNLVTISVFLLSRYRKLSCGVFFLLVAQFKFLFDIFALPFLFYWGSGHFNFIKTRCLLTKSCDHPIVDTLVLGSLALQQRAVYSYESMVLFENWGVRDSASRSTFQHASNICISHLRIHSIFGSVVLAESATYSLRHHHQSPSDQARIYSSNFLLVSQLCSTLRKGSLKFTK